MTSRFLAFILLSLSTVFLPAWFSFIFGVALCFAYPRYVEFFFAALILDMIGSARLPYLYGFEHLYLSLALAILLASELLRRFTRFLPHSTHE